MNLLSSLRSRIFLAIALLTVLSIGAAIYLVSVRVTRELEASLIRRIRSTGSLVDQLRTTRAQTFTTMARLIADAPKLKAAVDTNDPPTVQDNANDYQNQLRSNLLLVTNKRGQVLATVGASARAAEIVASQPSLRGAIAGRESMSLLPQPDGILHLASVPIVIGVSEPDILGTLSVGFLLDDAFAAQLKQITGDDIAFGMGGQILASTLPREQRAALAAALGGSDISNITVGSDEYAVLPMRLNPDDAAAESGGPMALVLHSRTEQRQFLSAIHTELFVTAVVAVLLATILSFTVARTIARPLAAITGVMRDVAATGDLTRKIVLRQRWDDEDARLLATTFNTLTDSVARAQRDIAHRERLSSLGRLSTVIAHEVRNPLMIIKAALHSLRQPTLTPEGLREIAADIDGEVVRLNRIVNEVLDFARPIRFDLAATDLNAVCRESVAAAQAGPGPAVEATTDERLPPVVCDGERLRVALVNLIVNARHASGDSGAAVRVVTEHRGDNATIAVVDQGKGIDRADLPRVFDPYFTTKRGGTGLGLPIAKNIVEGLGGTISVVSEPARGTEILITFPLEIARGRSVA
jgi:signal transduction histidine kinase